MMKNSRWLQQLISGLIVVLMSASLVSCWPESSDAVNANPETDMDKVRVNITIDDAHADQMDQMAEQLKGAGLEIEQTLSTLGIVTGSIEKDKVSALSEITGVEAVEEDRAVGL